MTSAVGRRIGASAEAFRQAFANPRIRTLQLAHAGSVIGTWSYGVAILVYAFEQGGAEALGIVALARFVPAAVAAPFTSLLGDRFSRVRVMLAADLVRAAAMAGAATTALLDGPPAIVYALAALTSVAATAFAPAKSAFLPSLARTPQELTAANVASSTIESVGFLAGPALGGLLLVLTDASAVFALNGATFLWSGFLLLRLPVDERPAAAHLGSKASGVLRALGGGVVELVRQPSLALVVLLTAAATAVYGALTVLIVVLAVEMLEIGEAGVGLLNSALGVGGLLGAVAGFALVGRTRLAGPFALATALWGLPLALVGVWPNTALAFVLFGVIGVANTVVDVAGQTLLQRMADDAVLSRVFGVLRGLMYLGAALGGIAAPALLALLGERGTFLAVGLFLPVTALLSLRILAGVDATATAPGRELAVLQAVPMFAPLPAPMLEQLASSASTVRFPAGAEVFRQGEPGDRFYVVADGTVAVSVDSGPPKSLGRGEYFGEIALLRDVPRTATVRAESDVELLALDRDEFITAVTGHPESERAADDVVVSRLGLRSAPV